MNESNMNERLYFDYATYIAQFKMQFGIAVSPPTYEEYVQLYSRYFDKNNVQSTSNSSKKATNPEETCQETNVSPKEDANTEEAKLTKKRDRWSKSQISVLKKMDKWKELIESFKANHQNHAWAIIQ